MAQRRIRVAVIHGGRNSEHGVSVVSAGSVMAALDPAKYEVVPIGITEAGRWVLTNSDPASLTIIDRRLPRISDGVPTMLSADPSAPGLIRVGPAETTPDLEPGLLRDVDVVFPVLHGRFGEDGTIQGLFELAGVPYVGSGVFASAAAMDKEFTKKLLEVAGLSVGSYLVLRAGAEPTADDLDRLGLPLFVKPARAGSSVGISKVTKLEELAGALQLAREHDDKVLIEAAVAGREVECGVIEDEDGAPIASVPAEIRLVRGHDWYDFEAKYLDDACEFDVPADLDDATTARVRAAACRAFEALDCAGLARVDFFVEPDGTVIVNEVNTMPGFTPISMFPRMWAASGLDYPRLVDRLITAALRRSAR